MLYSADNIASLHTIDSSIITNNSSKAQAFNCYFTSLLTRPTSPGLLISRFNIATIKYRSAFCGIVTCIAIFSTKIMANTVEPHLADTSH